MAFRHIWVNTNLQWPSFVIGLLKQKSSLFMIRYLENQFLYFIVFHCYNQPLTEAVSTGWWQPHNIRAILKDTRHTARFANQWLTWATLWTSQWYNSSPRMETCGIEYGMLRPLDSYTTLYADCSSLGWWNMQTHRHDRSRLYQHPSRQAVFQQALSRTPLARRDLAPVG